MAAPSSPLLDRRQSQSFHQALAHPCHTTSSLASRRRPDQKHKSNFVSFARSHQPRGRKEAQRTNPPIIHHLCPIYLSLTHTHTAGTGRGDRGPTDKLTHREKETQRVSRAPCRAFCLPQQLGVAPVGSDPVPTAISDQATHPHSTRRGFIRRFWGSHHPSPRLSTYIRPETETHTQHPPKKAVDSGLRPLKPHRRFRYFRLLPSPAPQETYLPAPPAAWATGRTAALPPGRRAAALSDGRTDGLFSLTGGDGGHQEPEEAE